MTIFISHLLSARETNISQSKYMIIVLIIYSLSIVITHLPRGTVVRIRFDIYVFMTYFHFVSPYY